MELRCANGILHGIIEEGILEVTCKSRRCGKTPGVVVLHRYNLADGTYDTKMFKEPPTQTKESA